MRLEARAVLFDAVGTLIALREPAGETYARSARRQGGLAASVTPHISTAKGRMLLIYADGDAEWRRRQNDRFGVAMHAAGNRGVQVVEVPNRAHSSLLTDLNAKDDRIGDLIRRFIDEAR